MANGEEPKKSNVLLWVVLGCGGVLALVAVVSIVAAIAIPSLMRARRTTLEVNSVGSMRAYAEAQVMFHRNDWPGSGTPGVLEYATPYTLLSTQVDANGLPIDLIDAAFAGAAGVGAPPKHGYVFKDMATIGGVPINWVDDFGLSGLPSTYGRTGYRTFIINTQSTVFGTDQGRGGTFVADYPNDTVAAGWIIAE